MTNAPARTPKPQHAPGARLTPRPSDPPARANGAHKPHAHTPRITRRVSKAIHDLIWLGLSPTDAADRYKINHGAFHRILNLPSIKQLIQQETEVLRSSGRPSALRIIRELAEKESMPPQVRLNAARHLDTGDKGAGVTVNVGINTNITPGYQVMVPERYANTAHQILHQARSTRNVLDSQADVATSEKATPE